jgi:Phytanoyl-CoA dioxygenase (PhyH)
MAIDWGQSSSLRDAVMIREVTMEIEARAATDAEITHYHENGWVKMERFITPKLAGEMLETAKAEILERESDGQRSHDRGMWRDVYNLGRDDLIEPFATLSRSRVVGRNAQRFMRRDVPVGFHADMLAVKMPAGNVGSAITGYHQDFCNFPLDRAGLLTFWIALDELTPDQGVMRFLSGSHREGPLGKRNHERDERGLLDHYPFLEKEHPLSEPLHLKAGDCTVHSSLVVHGAPGNVTDRPRWAYLMSYYPCDALWTGAPHHIFNQEAGLRLLEPAVSPRFPIIYGN